MSLHARLSPGARAALDRQRRQSSAASIFISILGTTLLALILGIFALQPLPTPPDVEAYVPPKPPEPPSVDAPRHAVSREPARPSASSQPVIVVPVPRSARIPTVEVEPSENTVFGDGDDFGPGGIGDDPGPGSGGPVPLVLRKRCSREDRLALLAAGGGSAEIDERVTRSLRFLQSTQAPDGGWGRQHRTAMTGLALLAYLGRCETPLSPEFGDTVLRAITFLTDRGMRQQGRLTDNPGERHWPYEHAIATYALAEAETLCRPLQVTLPHLRETVQAAGQLIIDKQHPSGGWDYSYDESSSRGGDLSITGWHVQALKACKLTRIDFRNLKPCVRRALGYVSQRQASDGGFGYEGTAPAGELDHASLTGVGMLAFQMWGKDSASEVRRGARYALQRMPFEWDGPDCDLYAHYYLAQAMFQRGGTEWDEYRPRFRDALLASQGADGSWPVPGGGAKPNAVAPVFARDTADGRHYRTVLATLMLEVWYRYLPATR